jgi:hypothetical protein
MLNKKQVYCIATVLILTLLAAMMLMVSAQENEVTSVIDSRPPPYPTDNAVNPVADKIAELRAQGLTDDQIVQELPKFGMGWIPETGSSWIGETDTTYRPHANPFQRENSSDEKFPTTATP